MAAIAAPANIGPSDRLGLTLFLAAAVHGIIILGVSFTQDLTRHETPPSLDVILVPNRTEQTPEEADYLAQANQDGGGSSDTASRPTTPFSAQQRSNEFGVSPMRIEAASPEARDQQQQEVLTARFAEHDIPTNDEQTTTAEPQPKKSRETIERTLEIARLTAEINRDVEAYAKRPRKTFVHARTRESVAAAYMHEWVREVERVGNLNYPDQARRRNLSGALVLVVGINPNGTLAEMVLRSSSGFKLLDDAAQRIVTLASPFKPFPAKLREQTDILYITRTWQFQSTTSRLIGR